MGEERRGCPRSRAATETSVLPITPPVRGTGRDSNPHYRFQRSKYPLPAHRASGAVPPEDWAITAIPYAVGDRPRCGADGIRTCEVAVVCAPGGAVQLSNARAPEIKTKKATSVQPLHFKPEGPPGIEPDLPLFQSEVALFYAPEAQYSVVQHVVPPEVKSQEVTMCIRPLCNRTRGFRRDSNPGLTFERGSNLPLRTWRD